MRVEAPLRAGVLFDVDGTLVDSNYLHTLAWSRAFGDAGVWAPMHAVHRLIGMGSDQLVSSLLGHDCPDAVERRPARYRELLGEVRAFPGAAALLRRCHDSGLAVVLATSAPSDELEAAKAVLGGACEGGAGGGDRRRDDVRLDEVVDAQTSADEVEHAKPAPDVFEVAMARAGVDRGLALAVGDSVWDVEAAQAARIGCVAVESGGFSRHELAEAGAVAVYRNVAEIFDQFALSPLARLAP
jgi:phosphoglycolate phosphatase-like HAD superfamily hydrolase